MVSIVDATEMRIIQNRMLFSRNGYKKSNHLSRVRKGYPICAFYSITYFGTSCNYPVKFEKAALIFCYFFEKPYENGL